MEDVNNSGLIILLIVAALFFILWVIYLVRYLSAKSRIKTKNRKLFDLVKGKDERDTRIWDQENTIRKDEEVIAGLKAELKASAQKAVMPEPASEGQATEGQVPEGEAASAASQEEHWDEFTVLDPDLEDRIMLHDLEDAIFTSKLYLKQEATKDDVAALISVDRKRLDTLLKNREDITAMDLLGKYRLEEAIAKIRETMLDAKKKKGEADAEPKKEVTLEDIAKESGFPSVRAMNKAAKIRYGMSVNELRKVIKI